MKIWVCKFCNRKIALKFKRTKSAHLGKCRDWKLWKDSVLTKEFLQINYVKLGKSFPQIAEDLGLETGAAIYNKAKSLGIKIRNVSESRKMPKAKRRHKDGCLRSFGATHNFCSGSSPRLLMQKRLFEQEGITNVFQRQEVKEQIRKTWEIKYGTRNLWTLEWYRKKIRKSCVYAGIHQKVYKYIRTDLNIDCEIEFPIKSGKTKQSVFLYDIRYKNKLIEVNGDYWHANPGKYKETSVFHFPRGQFTSQQIWEQDKHKLQVAQDAGYTIMLVW